MCPSSLIFLAIPAVIILFVLGKYLRSSNAFQDKLMDLGGERMGMNTGTFICDGQSVTLYYYHGSKNKCSELRLFVEGNFFGHAVIRREGGVDQFAKNIGLNEEFQSNDPSVDEQLYFECDDAPFLQQLTNSSEAKAAMKALLVNFTKIEIDGGRCSVVKTPCPQVSSVDSTEVQSAAKQLAALTKHIPRSSGGEMSSTPLTDEFKHSQGFFFGVGVALFMAGFALCIWGISSFEPVDKGRLFMTSLSVSLPALVAFTVYAFRELRGRSSSARVFFASMFMVTIGLVLSCFGGGAVLNGLWDISRKEIHETPVISKHVSHSKSSTNYNVTVAPWNNDMGNYGFRVSYSQYNRINPSDICKVATRSGFWGFEWVVSHSCKAR